MGVAMGGVVLPVMVAGLVLLRNDQLDRAERALKVGDGPAALVRLKPLARLGDQAAQMLLGSIYSHGWGGVPIDDSEAVYWFRRCGPVGNLTLEEGVDPAAPLEFSVAKRYAQGGDGVKADPEASIKWLRLAAKGGSKKASEMLAQPARAW